MTKSRTRIAGATKRRWRRTRAVWRWLRSPSQRFSLSTLVVIGVFAGVVLWNAFAGFVAYTNTEEFCISCHEMREFVYKEYTQTVHYSNRTGVRAVCSDCHVPKNWFYKMRRKIVATNELYHKIMGTISTREKFEARRLHLAQSVWRTMKATDSRECRNCHSFGHMDFAVQARRSKRKHRGAIRQNKTCIDCHKGIAHKLPKGLDDD